MYKIETMFGINFGKLQTDIWPLFKYDMQQLLKKKL